jgi:coenzyme F420-0:L-glutamate ligase/coenzyme F420-1:gamma-L-glutamate ligase
MPLVLTPLSGFPLVAAGDSLAALVLAALEGNHIELDDGDIIVLGQKVVSKAEGRMINLAEIKPTARARQIARKTSKDARVIEIILNESRRILRAVPGIIIVEHKLGFICANAGIDHSNVAGPGSSVEEYVLLLPSNPDRSAAQIRSELELHVSRRLGIIINDSHGRPWRFGTVGTCIGVSGVPPLVDERGRTDLFGYRLKATIVGVADELAAAASLMMGQAAEGMPVVHVRGFPYPLREGSMPELLRPAAQDLFR